MRWVNYQHLYYFWNIAQAGSVTKAAMKLRLAQPTISAQIKTFEETIGEKLFERDGRNLKLTDAGQVALEYADKIFSLGEEMLDVLDGHLDRSNKDFNIGISDIVPKTLAYRLIKPALVENRNITVCCFEDKTERLLRGLEAGELDLVVTDRPIPKEVKIKAYNHFIGESSIAFLGSANFKKSLKKNFPKSLNGAPLLLPTSESVFRGALDRWFDKIDVRPDIVGSFQDSALIKIAARDKKGVIPVPSVVARQVMKDFELEYIGETDEVKESFYLISLERRLKNPIIIDISVNGRKVMLS